MAKNSTLKFSIDNILGHSTSSECEGTRNSGFKPDSTSSENNLSSESFVFAPSAESVDSSIRGSPTICGKDDNEHIVKLTVPKVKSEDDVLTRLKQDGKYWPLLPNIA